MDFLNYRRSVFYLLLLSFSSTICAQENRYAATVTPVLNAPYSPFLEDYSDPVAQKLLANIHFYDFNEPSWTFKLHLEISNASGSFHFETLDTFTPSNPITVLPGEIKQLSGSDWLEYFLPENYLLKHNQGTNNHFNRLPEGLYQFCIEIRDYQTNEPLSPPSCIQAYIELKEPPRIQFPVAGQYINPKDLIIPFQWELFYHQDFESSEFKLELWEVNSNDESPLLAVENGNALKVFEKTGLRQTIYPFGISDLGLNMGEIYVFRVRAMDSGYRNPYKNDGYSAFSYFYYGWPEGGEIELVYPEKNEFLSKKEIPKLIWNAPDNIIPGQGVKYTVDIVEKEEHQTPEAAARNNKPWYRFESQKLFSNNQQIDTFSGVSPMQEYAWWVKAYSDFQEIASSKISNFFGPNLVDFFYAGNHKILVDRLKGRDLSSISGTGKVKLEEHGEYISCSFENLSLTDKNGYFILDDGEIIIGKKSPVSLEPEYSDNGPAIFTIEKYRLNRYGLYVYGGITWTLPHATTNFMKSEIKSRKSWVYFDDFQLSGGITMDSVVQNFELLDPYEFELTIDTTSLIFLKKDKYQLELDGSITASNHFKTSSEKRKQFYFSNAEQLYYLKENSSDYYFASHIRPASNTLLEIIPNRYTIDLSDSISINKPPNWKGIHLDDFALELPVKPDLKQNLILRSDTLLINDSSYCFLSSSGLEMSFIQQLDHSVEIHGFSATLTDFKLEIHNNEIMDSSGIKGKILIPIIDNQFFEFGMKLSNLGFDYPQLINLNSQSIHFADNNPTLNITFREGHFGIDHINFLVDAEIPDFDITLNNIRGFRIWQDYAIGFIEKNGTIPLEHRKTIELNNYPAILKTIGAGYDEGSYAFGFSADIDLGDDVAGDGTAPTVNIYNISKNEYAPNSESINGTNYSNESTLEESVKNENNFEEEIDYFSFLNAKSGPIYTGIENLKVSISGPKIEKPTTESLVLSSMSDFEESEYTEDSRFNKKQLEIIDEITNGLAYELTLQLMRPVDQKIDSINLIIEQKILELAQKPLAKIDVAVNKITSKAASDLINLLQNDKVDVSVPIQQIAAITESAISRELRNGVMISVKENLIFPVRSLLQVTIKEQIRSHLIHHSSEAIYLLILGEKQDAKSATKHLITELSPIINNILNESIELVNLENIQQMIKSLVRDAIVNIDSRSVVNEIRAHSEEIIKEEINRLILSQAGNLLGDNFEEFSITTVTDAPLDFTGIAMKIIQGDVKGAFALDPVHVKLNTPIIQLDGYIHYIPGDPLYGEVWASDMDMKVKVPRDFAMNAKYINGRKDDLSYWFVQISPPRGSGEAPFKIGDPIPKKGKPLANPVKLGIVKLMAASGRLYHHMEETPSGSIIPSAEMKYGAYLNLVLFDEKSAGKNMRLAIEGEINTAENGDYTLSFMGSLQLQNKTPRVLEPDRHAGVLGTLELYYNSAEKHFLGYAHVILNKPDVLCAEGSLLVDVKPSKWRIALGSREERLIFVPGCMGWSPTGWLDLNESRAELGLGLQWSVTSTFPSGKTPLIVGPYQVNFTVDAGIAFGIVAGVQYKPFTLEKAGIWADLWAVVVMNYKALIKSQWKSTTLVDILLKGDLMLYFVPKPTILEGNLRGHISVLFFQKQITTSLTKEI